jgi:hypothetical protein
MQTKTQMQYRSEKSVLFLKKLLHTKWGAKLGFLLGIKGFNRVGVIHTSSFSGKVRNLGFSYNSRVNKGADLIASLITGAAQNSISSPLPPKYIALSTSTLSPASGDTTLSGETAVAGIARALGTQGNYTGPVALDGAASYTVTKTFTLTGASTTVVSAALFDSNTSGNLFVEANFGSQAVMVPNDTLAVTWTVNL